MLFVLGISLITVNMRFLAEEASPATFVCCYSNQKILVRGSYIVIDKMNF